MKKIVFTITAFIAFQLSIKAQQAAKINGQPFSQGDWFGSNNNESVLFKANNNIGMKIKPNGEIVFKSLDLNSSTGPNGLVLTDGQGKIYRLNFPNDASKVLLGDGTFGTFLNAGQWLTSGSNLYWNTGNVSIGSTPNSFKFNVEGDARVSNDLFVNHDLFVGGGIVISDKIQAVTEIKGWDFKVENDIQVTGSSRFNGSAQVDQNLAVVGDATFENILTAKKGVMFDALNGLKLIPPTTTSPAGFYIGSGTYQPLSTACPTPHSNFQYFATQGAYISHIGAGANPNAPLIDASLSMQCAAWNGSGYIEVEGKDNLGALNNALFLNYFCGRNTHINVGWDIPNGVDGGTVFMGAKVDLQNSLKIGWNADPTINLNTSIDLNNYTNSGNGLKLNTWNNSVKFLTINNSNFANSPFTVFANGKTQIGSGKVGSGPHSNAMLTVDGKIAAKEIQVFINPSWWADYVFEKDYKLMPLNEVEKFYKENKHLPDVPSTKEVVENGNNLAQTDATLLRKIEENTIYLVEMNKKLEKLVKENEDLKNRVKQLEK